MTTRILNSCGAVRALDPRGRTLGVVLVIALGLAACGTDIIQAGAPPQEPAAVVEGEPPAETETTPAEDGGIDAAKDSGKGAAPPAKDPPKDAGPDALLALTPLACVVPGLPIPACPNGVAPNFASQALAPIAARGTRLRVDNGGFYQASWHNSKGVSYLTNRSGAFVVESVTGLVGLPNEAITLTRLAVDDCGTPTVLYLRSHLPAMSNKYDFRLFLATRKVGGWVHEPIEVPTSDDDASPATDYSSADLVLDDAGSPIVVLTRYSDSRFAILRRSGATFTAETLSIGGSRSFLPAAVWSNTLGLSLVYADGSASRPAVAWKLGSSWTESILSSEGPVDSFSAGDPSIAAAAGADGTVHVAYRIYPDSAGRRLRYASIAAPNAWTTPRPLPLSNGYMPEGITVLLAGTGKPRVTFNQFNGSQSVAHVSRLTDGVVLPAVVVGVSLDSGRAIDSSGREHVLTTGTVTKLYTQSCLP